MTTYIALFRAVNVGGKSVVSSAALCGLAQSAGFRSPRTLLQTGNLVFEAVGSTGNAIEAAIESEATRQLGLDTSVIVRTAHAWQRLIDVNPFPGQAENDPAHLLVVALKGLPEPADVRSLRKSTKGREVLEAIGSQLYVVYPDGIGRSKLTMRAIEQALGLRGTGRNWNTVLKLAAACRRDTQGR